VSVLTIVSVEVTALAPVISAEAGFKLHVTGLLAPAGLVVSAQVRFTVPVKPVVGVTVTVAVPFDPCVIEIGPLLLMLNVGAALMVTLTAVLCVMLPDAPVTVNVYAPGVVLVVESIVSAAVNAAVPVMLTEVGIEQVGAVIPPGGFVMVQLRVTAPVNPLEGVTLIVDVLPVVAPGLTAMLPLLLSAKLGEGALEPPTFNSSPRVCSWP
jgi:hypothetical protein